MKYHVESRGYMHEVVNQSGDVAAKFFTRTEADEYCESANDS